MRGKKRFLNEVTVYFKDSQYNYTTNVSCSTTEESAKKYFVGTYFNVEGYPSENMQKCIKIEFKDNNK